MISMLCTFTDTAPRRDYCDKKAFQGLWEYLLNKNDYDEVAVNLCPFAVPTFLVPGTQPVSMEPLDATMHPGRRVTNWWEGMAPAPGPRLRVTLDPPSGSWPIAKGEYGTQIPPAGGWNTEAVARTADELGTASGVSFKGELAEELFQRGWEDKGLIIYPVDYAFRPDPARLAEAWGWLDAYLAGSDRSTDIPADSELADGKPWRFMGTDWRYVPVDLPPNYRFDRMFFWSWKQEIFFQPAEMDSRCPFCGAHIDFEHVGDALGSHSDEDGTLTSLDMITPCCSKPTTVNELDFDGCFGVGKFSIRFIGWVKITDEALNELGRILGTRLKMLHSAR